MSTRVTVQNMQSPQGNDVPNQFEIFTDDGKYFQSYRTLIAFKPANNRGPVRLNKDAWDYSRTTVKYRNAFLDMTTAQVKAGIADGSILLVEFGD